MYSDTSLNLSFERLEGAALTPIDNPTLLAVLTLHEWQLYTQQCQAHPTVSPDFPTLTIKVEGRSLDLYLEAAGKGPENIGMVYMEIYSKQTITELEKAVEKGLLHPRELESEQMKAADAYVALYYEWFEDTASWGPPQWAAIGRALRHRMTTIPACAWRMHDPLSQSGNE